MSDPFQDGHKKEAVKKSVQDAATQVVARDKRIADAAQRRGNMARPDPAYPWPRKFWDLSS